MSYCRWSSMDWSCDLYVYEDCGGGWTIHVASNRPVDIPKNPHKFPSMEWIKFSSKEQTNALENCVCIDITLEHSGDSFPNQSKEDTILTLEKLRDLGYTFPFDIIEEIKEEE